MTTGALSLGSDSPTYLGRAKDGAVAIYDVAKDTVVPVVVNAYNGVGTYVANLGESIQNNPKETIITAATLGVGGYIANKYFSKKK